MYSKSDLEKFSKDELILKLEDVIAVLTEDSFSQKDKVEQCYWLLTHN